MRGCGQARQPGGFGEASNSSYVGGEGDGSSSDSMEYNDKDVFLQTYRAPLAFYKLMELRSARSPVFLPRTLSYRAHGRAVRWKSSDVSTIASEENTNDGETSAPPLGKHSVLQNFFGKNRWGLSKKCAVRLREAPKFATLYIKGFIERSDSKSPANGKGVGKSAREKEVPITIGLYEEHLASGGAELKGDDSPTSASPLFYSLVESHVLAIPSTSLTKADRSDTKGFPVELGVDIAPYLKSGRRVFAVVHVYNPSVLKNDAWFFGVSRQAVQTTAPPDNTIVREIQAADIFQKKRTVTPALSPKKNGTRQTPSRQKRPSKSRGSRLASPRSANGKSSDCRTASDSSVDVASGGGASRKNYKSKPIPKAKLPAHRPTRRQIEALRAHEDGQLPPMAAFWMQFELVIAKQSDRETRCELASAGDYNRVCSRTESNFALQNHPLSNPSIMFELDWDYKSAKLRTLPGGRGRYRRLCRGLDLKRRLSGIPPLTECTPIVTWNYVYGGGGDNERYDVRRDFCCAWCQQYCPDMASLVCHLTCSHEKFRYESRGTVKAPEIWIFPNTSSQSPVEASKKSLKDANDEEDRDTVHRRTGGRSGLTALRDKEETPSNYFFTKRVPRALRLLTATELQEEHEKMSAMAHSTPGKDAAAGGSGTDAGTNGSDKAPVECSDHREFQEYKDTAHLYFRRYYHSKTSQPMSNPIMQPDSDDEVDEDWILEQNERLLDEFEDVSIEEKQIMKMWNQYIFYNKVYADRLLPQTCLDFTKRHAQMINEAGLRGNFLLHLLTLWDYALITSDTIAECMINLDKQKAGGNEGAASQAVANKNNGTAGMTLRKKRKRGEASSEPPANPRKGSLLRKNLNSVKTSVLS
jgi:hypothetical protein